eukprot:4383155-Pleurochrysis_carterae.AAC.1
MGGPSPSDDTGSVRSRAVAGVRRITGLATARWRNRGNYELDMRTASIDEGTRIVKENPITTYLVMAVI